MQLFPEAGAYDLPFKASPIELLTPRWTVAILKLPYIGDTAMNEAIDKWHSPEGESVESCISFIGGVYVIRLQGVPGCLIGHGDLQVARNALARMAAKHGYSAIN